ncbi:Zinc finger, PHD-finger [Parasponia andersonii]|uniref:Zinc finger, PHD-finger n=1 Tax=Parasponia andersonii TaxID=3476 RepID=A0A2P5D167_PARAD|nr:Zinc finger, PHD-finger [Parasponia andersonii]
MVRGGKVSSKRKFRNRFRSKDKGSDDSDEDYVVSDEENEVSGNSDEDYCFSVDGFASEDDSFDEEENEEEERETKRVKKVGRSKSRTRSRNFIVEEEEEEEEVEEEEEDIEEVKKTTRSKVQSSFSEEEESRMTKKKSNTKAGKRVSWKKGSLRGQKRRRKSMVSKRPLSRKVKKKCGFRRKVRCDDDVDFIDSGLVLKEKSAIKTGRKRRRFVLPSDSDFASSGYSDYEYTISEEEREQVREAREFCGQATTNLRSSSVSDKIRENVVVQLERKPTGRKGKEKVEELKAEVVKQRFITISKPAKSTAGVDLRVAVITVPERDQVYQPSEEELRSYLDPYENVICTECHEGGDDGLMLLCDLCDSPAHTYCVGLEQEVPEGNWYCDGCRPVALGSSSSLAAQTRLSDQRTNRPSPIVNYINEGLDLNSVSSQVVGSLSSPRYHFGGFQASSSLSRAGAPTLLGRRSIHRHIQQLLSVNRMNHSADRAEGNSGANFVSGLLYSPVDQRRETTIHRASTLDTGVYHAFFQERFSENPSPAAQDPDLLSPRLSQPRRQTGQDPTTVPANGTLWPGLAGRNSLSGYEQPQQYSSRPNDGCDREEADFHTAKEQLQSMVKSHLKNLSRDSNLAQGTFKDIARSSTHTILAACELEHKSNEVAAVPPPPICGHIELVAGGKASLMRGCCSTCFDSFVVDVVKKILDTKLSEQWLSLGL